ncbi:MAG: hypothetical protein MI919_35305 [Holophagales bacterium]|nr:hypothetical protein [Holophagales bacterium]
MLFRRTVLISLVALLCPAAGAELPPDPLEAMGFEAGDLSNESANLGGGGEVLFDSIQYHVGGAFSVTSQNHVGFVFPTTNEIYETFGADDFEVTDGGWRIDTVEVKGNYFSGSGPAESVNIYILPDGGPLPGTTAIPEEALVVLEELPFVDNTPQPGDLVVPLPAPFRLDPGTYWLVVQVNLPLPNQWGWTTIETSPGSGEGLGAMAAWMQNAPGVGPECVDFWGTLVTTCGIDGGVDPPAPDFAFILRGSRIPTPPVAIPTLSQAFLLGLLLMLGAAGLMMLRR